MKTLLLLAGRSTRFWPLTEKTLFPICGKTLLEHQIDRLKKGGCADIVLVGGKHNLEEAQKLFPELQTIEQENLELGMRGALLSALPHVGNAPILIVGSNDVIDPEAYASLLKTKADGAILAYKVDRYFPGGYLTVQGDRIEGIVEKPGEGKEPSDLVNIVAHLHNNPSALLDALQSVDESQDDGYEQALAKLFQSYDYRAVEYTGVWKAVKYPWHLLELLPVLLSEISKPVIHKSADIHKSAVITGPVVIEEGVKVYPNATITGPCYIGKHSVVANNALVRGSSLGEHCIAGFSTEIKGSILHSHVWTHMNYIGDSVLGRNVSLGGGTITGNLRLDEGEISSVVKGEKISTRLQKFGTVIGDNCRIGINVSINPGCKIGGQTFVSSAALVASDIPEKSFAAMKSGSLEIRENTTHIPTPEERQHFRSVL